MYLGRFQRRYGGIFLKGSGGARKKADLGERRNRSLRLIPTWGEALGDRNRGEGTTCERERQKIASWRAPGEAGRRVPKLAEEHHDSVSYFCVSAPQPPPKPPQNKNSPKVTHKQT